MIDKEAEGVTATEGGVKSAVVKVTLVFVPANWKAKVSPTAKFAMKACLTDWTAVLSKRSS